MSETETTASGYEFPGAHHGSRRSRPAVRPTPARTPPRAFPATGSSCWSPGPEPSPGIAATVRLPALKVWLKCFVLPDNTFHFNQTYIDQAQSVRPVHHRRIACRRRDRRPSKIKIEYETPLRPPVADRRPLLSSVPLLPGVVPVSRSDHRAQRSPTLYV